MLWLVRLMCYLKDPGKSHSMSRLLRLLEGKVLQCQGILVGTNMIFFFFYKIIICILNLGSFIRFNIWQCPCYLHIFSLGRSIYSCHPTSVSQPSLLPWYLPSIVQSGSCPSWETGSPEARSSPCVTVQNYKMQPRKMLLPCIMYKVLELMPFVHILVSDLTKQHLQEK